MFAAGADRAGIFRCYHREGDDHCFFYFNRIDVIVSFYQVVRLAAAQAQNKPLSFYPLHLLF